MIWPFTEIARLKAELAKRPTVQDLDDERQRVARWKRSRDEAIAARDAAMVEVKKLLDANAAMAAQNAKRSQIISEMNAEMAIARYRAGRGADEHYTG